MKRKAKNTTPTKRDAETAGRPKRKAKRGGRPGHKEKFDQLLNDAILGVKQ